MTGKQHKLWVCSAFVLLSSTLCSGPALAQSQNTNQNSATPLVRVLQAKGILTAEEVAQLTQASSANDADSRLAKLLLTKGIISQADYNQMLGDPSVVTASSPSSTSVSLVPAVYHVPGSAAAAPAAAPAVASAVASNAPVVTVDSDQQQVPPSQTASVSPTTISAANPIRPLPVGGIKKGELKPAITVAGVGITPYGFLKATFVHDSSSPGGDDFPLPGFLGDTGPNGAPEFHVKARASRFGTNFEWGDSNPNLTVTGKVEFDFEGNFNRSDNRNLSSIRSSNPSIRLAFGRIDYKFSNADTFSALFGQDWTPFTSSTLPNILETTGVGIGFGVLWERAPQMRFGWTHNFGAFQLMPEIAVVLPALGDVPSAANLSNQLGYGERQGPDSGSPQLEGRLVGQWQLDHAPGVAPAELIVSFEEASRTAIVLGSAVPAAYHAAFPTGARVGSPTNGVTFEWQLPTHWVTLIGKVYSGSDLRYYFGGQLFSNYNSVFGLKNTADALSIDGGSTVVFGTNASGNAVVAPELPVRARGGFAQIGLPLSRWFGMDPEGRNAGWSLYGMYGTDQANTNDLAKAAPGGSRARSDMTVGTLNYKLNKWVSFSFEQSLYRTRANTAVPDLPLFMGRPQHEWRDLRSEGGAIFSF
ncbi:MAG TPA: hypothetical protein VLA42_01965 [Verrucomicrobiae bacterium]|jgi:hypothetical protein|nr:hypothetical protein [Verrucomicrobiae bacterium]